MHTMFYAIAATMVVLGVYFYVRKRCAPISDTNSRCSLGDEPFRVDPVPFPHQTNDYIFNPNHSHSQSYWIAPGAYGEYTGHRNTSDYSIPSHFAPGPTDQKGNQINHNYNTYKASHVYPSIGSPEKSAKCADFSTSSTIDRVPSEKTLLQSNSALLLPLSNMDSISLPLKIDDTTPPLTSPEQASPSTETLTKKKPKPTSQMMTEETGKVLAYEKELLRITNDENCPTQAFPRKATPASESSQNTVSKPVNPHLTGSEDPNSSHQPTPGNGRIEMSSGSSSNAQYLGLHMHDPEDDKQEEEVLPRYTSGKNLQLHHRISLKQDHSYIGRMSPNYHAPPTISRRGATLKEELLEQNSSQSRNPEAFSEANIAKPGEHCATLRS